MKGYLSDTCYNSESDAYKAIMKSKATEICAEGPARTGKTITCLRKVLALHAKHKGLRSCIVRTNSVDLTDTVRYDIANLLLKYPLDDPKSQIEQRGGVTKFDHLYLNGGECKLGGMNRPGAILGGQYDIVYLSELSQFTEHQYLLLKTRCSGSSAKWRDKSGNVRFQMLADTNPDEEGIHWMYKREQDGLMEFVKFGFKDNPHFFRGNRWTKVGKTTVEEMDRSLTGHYHDIYFKGLRVGPAGRVFRLQPKDYIETLPDLSDYLIYNAMDFGISSPNVCLWIAENNTTRNIIVIAEYRKTDETIIDMGAAVKAHSETEGYKIVNTVIDNDEHRQKLLRSETGIYAEMARKGSGSIMDGVILIQQALKENRLQFYTGLRINSDPELTRKKKPLDVITEMKLYHFKEEAKMTGTAHDQNPVKGDDHGIDALRYWFLWRHGTPQLDFYGAKISRNIPKAKL